MGNAITCTINKATRIFEKSRTLLDHIYTNCSNSSAISGIMLTDISDHLPTFIYLYNRKCKKRKDGLVKQASIGGYLNNLITKSFKSLVPLFDLLYTIIRFLHHTEGSPTQRVYACSNGALPNIFEFHKATVCTTTKHP